jgi:tetratricopeptide (TPR) repeat protein
VKSGLSRKLEGVILKCLEKEPGKRYPSVRELQSDLERLSAGVTPLAARRLWPIIATAAIVVVMLGVGAFFYLRQSLKLTEKDTVVLADFVNTTGEAVFDAALKQALIVQLEQSPFLNVLSDQKVSEQLKYMGRSADERLTQDVAREVCQRSGSKAMLVGSISGLGSHYAVGLKTVNCRTGDSLGDEQLEAESREKILKALGEAATKMRGKLGESLSTIAKYDTPIQQATTPSLEALNAFALGTAQRTKGAETESIPFFKRAIELDPNFALAEAVLGQAYSNLGERELANEHTTNAFTLRARVSEHERLYISSHYYGLVMGEMDKTVESYELWKQIYPRESDPHNNLAVYYDVTGQFEKGVQEAQEALRLDPNGSTIYANLAWGHLGLNQWAKGKAVCDQAIATRLDGLPVHVFLYLIAFIQGEKAAMQREVDWASGKPIEDVMLRIVADAAASSGHLQEARQFFRRSVELAQLHNFKERAALTTALEALAEGQVGNHGQALELARSALTMGHGTDVQEIAAQALASSGDRHQPQAIADDLGRRFPSDTFVNSFSLPVIRGAIELERGNPTKAVDYLQAATPYEFGVGAIPAFPGFAAIYLRGQAYLRAQDGKGAAIEFQKILDHRGTDPTSLLYALAHLGLARAEGQAGDTAKANAAYQDFLALWKDADPGIPILKEGKAEYAKLQ